MHSIERLISIMKMLRDPEKGCPWDLEQTWKSLLPYTLEETYEVIDAIEHGSETEVADELGDLLFQVVFYAQIASEESRFTFDDIVNRISDKLERRHPHVFADATVSSVEEQSHAWEKLKAEERKEKKAASALDDIGQSLPAILRAYKIQKRVARIGFDWPDIEGVYEKLEEELAEVKQEQQCGDKARLQSEMGDLLFACINLARHLDIDPEVALRETNSRFERRFRDVEQQVQNLSDASLETLEAAWQKAKLKFP